MTRIIAAITLAGLALVGAAGAAQAKGSTWDRQVGKGSTWDRTATVVQAKGSTWDRTPTVVLAKGSTWDRALTGRTWA